MKILAVKEPGSLDVNVKKNTKSQKLGFEGEETECEKLTLAEN